MKCTKPTAGWNAIVICNYFTNNATSRIMVMFLPRRLQTPSLITKVQNTYRTTMWKLQRVMAHNGPPALHSQRRVDDVYFSTVLNMKICTEIDITQWLQIKVLSLPCLRMYFVCIGAWHSIVSNILALSFKIVTTVVRGSSNFRAISVFDSPLPANSIILCFISKLTDFLLRLTTQKLRAEIFSTSPFIFNGTQARTLDTTKAPDRSTSEIALTRRRTFMPSAPFDCVRWFPLRRKMRRKWQASPRSRSVSTVDWDSLMGPETKDEVSQQPKGHVTPASRVVSQPWQKPTQSKRPAL